jgi:hypothetical protein
LPGFHDLDDAPGCEYSASPPPAASRLATGRQRPRQEIDEDFDLTDDVRNCGSCNHVCVAPHATAVCVEGDCD